MWTNRRVRPPEHRLAGTSRAQRGPRLSRRQRAMVSPRNCRAFRSTGGLGTGKAAVAVLSGSAGSPAPPFEHRRYGSHCPALTKPIPPPPSTRPRVNPRRPRRPGHGAGRFQRAGLLPAPPLKTRRVRAQPGRARRPCARRNSAANSSSSASYSCRKGSVLQPPSLERGESRHRRPRFNGPFRRAHFFAAARLTTGTTFLDAAALACCAATRCSIPARGSGLGSRKAPFGLF